MLGLKLKTDPRWVNLAEMSLEDILTDHAYCEQKATTSCISLIQQYPERLRLIEELSPVVTEEWGHFRMVLQEIKKRGLKLGNQRKDEYANKLIVFQKKGGSQTDRLIEKLLTFALIEARSCERFRLLSIELEEKELRNFYHQFMVAEANHYKMFIELARLYGEEGIVNKRWAEYLEYEAKVLDEMTLSGKRMH